MAELRKDPIVGRWVIISVERGKRPTDFISPSQRKKGGFCPFCPGNEHTVPPEIMAFRPVARSRIPLAGLCALCPINFLRSRYMAN